MTGFGHGPKSGRGDGRFRFGSGYRFRWEGEGQREGCGAAEQAFYPSQEGCAGVRQSDCLGEFVGTDFGNEAGTDNQVLSLLAFERTCELNRPLPGLFIPGFVVAAADGLGKATIEIELRSLARCVQSVPVDELLRVQEFTGFADDSRERGRSSGWIPIRPGEEKSQREGSSAGGGAVPCRRSHGR